MKRIRAAVIGVGYLGRFHAQKYSQMDDVELLGVVDTDMERAENIAEETGTKAYPDIASIPGDLDAVSIAAPTTLHASISIPLLERGIAVLVEKPMASTIKEAESIIKASEKGKAILQAGHLERFNPALTKLRDDIKKPMFIEAHRISPFKQRGADVDVILDIMIHDIDIILNLVDSPLKSLEAVGVPVLTQSADIANARLRFESGCIANITASRVSADTMRKIRIFQKDSYISIDFAKASVDIHSLTSDRQITHNNLKMSETDALASEIRSFIDAVKNNTGVVVDGIAGLKAIETAYRIKDAMILP